MADKGRYESAMFWLAFGTAAAVIGLALMTIGVARAGAGANLFASPWFDGGLGLLVVGGVLLLLSLVLYLARRRVEAQASAGAKAGSSDSMTEAVRGYYAEREKLISMWEKEGKKRPKK